MRVPPTGSLLRDINHVCHEEIAEACLMCVRRAYAIPQADLIVEIARLMGYQRTGAKVSPRITQGIQLCIQQGRIIGSENSLRMTT